MLNRCLCRAALGGLALLAAVPSALLGQDAVPADDAVSATEYLRAQQFLGWNANTLISGNQVNPQWMDGDLFWYRNRRADGTEFIVVNPAQAIRRPAFDHVRLAAALSMARDTAYEAFKLPFQEIELEDGLQTLRFTLDDSLAWRCDLASYQCQGPAVEDAPDSSARLSPDGSWIAFQREHDLWVRHAESGQEIQVSEGGEEWYGFGDRPEGCCSSVTDVRQGTERPPVVAWGPDGTTLLTHRVDRRNVREMALIETHESGPILHTYRNALPGDSVIPTLALHFFRLEGAAGGGTPSPRHVPVQKEAQEMVNTICCQVMAGDTIWKDVTWGSTGDYAFYTHGVRSFDRLDLIRADARTGEVHTVLTETGSTWLETNVRSSTTPNWRVIRGDTEVIWFSQRDGWGHLYRYDVASGEMLNRITAGPWVVMDIVHVDDAAGWVYFTAQGREEGRDPYFRHFYRARIDGGANGAAGSNGGAGAIELLSPEDADHDVRASPSGSFFVDSYSTRTQAPVTVVRNGSGQVVQTVEEADVSRLLAAGWQWPVPFTVKARDGITDLYGYLYFPPNMGEGAKYPVVDYIYPGPQVGPIGTRGFTASPGGNGHALSQLGFIVFTIDAFGTPGRSKAFHDHYYGDMGDNGLADHVAAMRQLAARYPQIDLDRVGIYGHSGGGFSSTGGILRFPDFFKVAVSTAGNHDNRSYDYTWGEKYQGLLEENPDGTDSFDSQANHLLADQLKGKLLLMHGTLDDNVHPNANLLLVDELIKHNKIFDFLVMPNRNHGFASEPYVIRRTWDYLVQHLQGRTPPADVKIAGPPG
ncbi:MAG: DPP IV N-terminal domain-containing protein [Gemmatimonadota bacterium]